MKDYLRVLVFEFLSSLESLEFSFHAPDDSGAINRPLQSKNDIAWMAPFNLNIVPAIKQITLLKPGWNFLQSYIHRVHTGKLV